MNKQEKLTPNSEKKKSDLSLSEVRVREGELKEGGQKVQTSSYNINKYQECDVQHDKYT